MRRLLLAVDKGRAEFFELRHQMDEGDLRRVRFPREHRLAEKHAPQREPIQPADELSVRQLSTE